MTDLNAALRAAILHDLLLIDTDGTIAIKLKSGIYRTRLHRLQDEIADAILAAIQPVLDDGVTVEWSFRRKDGRVMNAMSEEEARACVAFSVTGIRDGLTLVKRRVTEWAAMPHAS